MEKKEVMVVIAIVTVVLAVPLGIYAMSNYEQFGPGVDVDLVDDQRQVQAGETITYEFSVETPKTNYLDVNIWVSNMANMEVYLKSVSFTMDGKTHEVKPDIVSPSDWYGLVPIGDLVAGQHTGRVIVTYAEAGSYSVRATLENGG